MENNKPKTINGLMRYLRDEKHISISGTSDKKRLRMIGYYHGYKGYRYINKPSNRINYSKFDEIMAIIEFDSQIKAIFYPCVMKIETALKNYALEVIIEETNTENFMEIYNKVMCEYKEIIKSGHREENDKTKKRIKEEYVNAIIKRLDVRNRVYSVQSSAFRRKNNIAEHYLLADKILPIWAIFELLSLGEFGYFISCLNYSCRSKLSKMMGVDKNCDTNAKFPQRIIFLMKELRNAIAHDDVVFDLRFKNINVSKKLSRIFQEKMKIDEIKFNTITDYLLLVIYLLKDVGVSTSDLKKIINSFVQSCEKLKKEIDKKVYSQIIFTNNDKKITKLLKYISCSA